MKKKIFLFLFIIITSLSLLENVKAEKVIVQRHDVTNLNIRDEKITFTGWAFINCTQNYTDYKETIHDSWRKWRWPKNQNQSY